MAISKTVERALFQKSGNRCAFPKCTSRLISPDSPPDAPIPTSNIAHIVGEKLDSPRGNYPLSVEKRNDYSNLILLCLEHHTVIDTHPDEYPVEMLREWKRNHESFIDETVSAGIAKRDDPQVEVSKKIYLSYGSTTNWALARLIFERLKARGFDPFMSPKEKLGKYMDVLQNQIEARPHFLVILTPSTFEKWRSSENLAAHEIEHALRSQRNIVPITAYGFSFSEYDHYLASVVGDLSQYSELQLQIPDIELVNSKTVQRLSIRLPSSRY